MVRPPHEPEAARDGLVKAWGVVAAAGLGLALLPPLAGFPPYLLFLLGTALLFATLTSAWSLLAYAGQMSFGHAAFFGLGAYAAALASLNGLWPWAGVALGALAGASGACAIGLAAARLRGAYLALATLAYAEVWRGIALNWTTLTGGGAGLLGIPSLPPLAFLPWQFTTGRAGVYYLSLAMLLSLLVLLRLVTASRVGLALAAVREDEERASLLGLRPLAWKLLAFSVSGLFAGLVGGAYAHAVRVVEPDLVFNRYYSILPLVMATVGGPHTWLGPPASAIGLYLLSEAVLHPLAPAFHQAVYALALVIVVLHMPGGLTSLFRRGRRAHP